MHVGFVCGEGFPKVESCQVGIESSATFEFQRKSVIHLVNRENHLSDIDGNDIKGSDLSLEKKSPKSSAKITNCRSIAAGMDKKLAYSHGNCIPLSRISALSQHVNIAFD